MAGRLLNILDVRELPTWREPSHPPYLNTPETNTEENRKAWDEFHRKGGLEDQAILSAIRNAIEKGLLENRKGGKGDEGAPPSDVRGPEAAPPVKPLFWSERGEIACRAHAPHEGSDTWKFDGWCSVAPDDRLRWSEIAGKTMDCETCAHIPEKEA
jgi:hypothetical protein